MGGEGVSELLMFSIDRDGVDGWADFEMAGNAGGKIGYGGLVMILGACV